MTSIRLFLPKNHMCLRQTLCLVSGGALLIADTGSLLNAHGQAKSDNSAKLTRFSGIAPASQVGAARSSNPTISAHPRKMNADATISKLANTSAPGPQSHHNPAFHLQTEVPRHTHQRAAGAMVLRADFSNLNTRSANLRSRCKPSAARIFRSIPGPTISRA
mgnify:CR=1 FL=1